VGAGFAGLAAARCLDRRHTVTVIDRSVSFEWLPNIHELLSGAKRPADLRLPTRRLVTRAGHRHVRIVAVGGVNDTYGVRGADRRAMPFKSVADCAAIGRRLAALARQREERSVVIVGGGLEGIEALGEILRRFRARGSLRVSVVEWCHGLAAVAGLRPGRQAQFVGAGHARFAEHAVREGVRRW